MKHQNYKTATEQYRAKSQNEDCAYDWPTDKGHIFFVIDFASFNYTTLNLTLQRTLEEIVRELDKLPGLSADSFLGHVGKELNNFVYAFGRDNCDGKLFCVAAIALLHGDNLYYLTYGDSRINIFTDDRLMLLNGAKYQARSVISDTKDVPARVRENPEQMGRSLFEMPLTERVRSFELSDDDIILIFTDGLEENVTPQRRLSELRTLGKTDPQAICDAMLKISDATDDRTITVIGGPYQPLGNSLLAQVNKAFEQIDKRLNAVEAMCTRQTEITGQLNSALGALPNNYVPRSELTNLTKQLNSDNNTSKVASLEQRITQLESKNGKGRGRSAPAEGPLVFTLDQAAYDKIREIVGGNPAKESKKTETTDSSQEPEALIKNKVEHKKSQPESAFSRFLSNPKVVMASIFLFGMLALLLLQMFHRKFWPERWIARTEGESLVVRRADYFSTGPVFTVRLPPPVPYLEQEAGSFEELAPVIAKLQSARPQPTPTPSPSRNDNSAVPTDTVQPATVLQNDSLSKIAKRFNTTEQKVRELNPNIVNWDKLRVGDQIRVPSANVNGNSQN
jgi:hypothetical protein